MPTGKRACWNVMFGSSPTTRNEKNASGNEQRKWFRLRLDCQALFGYPPTDQVGMKRSISNVGCGKENLGTEWWQVYWTVFLRKDQRKRKGNPVLCWQGCRDVMTPDNGEVLSATS